MRQVRAIFGRGSAVVAVASLVLAGLTGSSAAADSSVTTVKGEGSSKSGWSWAQCPEGTELIGGGFTGGESQAPVDASGPSISRAGAWAAHAQYSYVTAYALCDSNSAPTTAIGGNTVTGNAFSYAQCPANTDLIGGGYATYFGFNGFHQTSDTIDGNGPSSSRPGAWAVHSTSGYATSAYALCRDQD